MQKLKKSEISRARILERAEHLFTENGFQSTGIDEISRAAGMTSGAFYGQFKSKLALLDVILKQKIENSREQLLSVREKESAHEWIRRALKMYLSREHRDAKAKSCPLTTLSAELTRMEEQVSMPLLEYTQYFAHVLERRLLLISSENKDLAYPLMAMCMGAVQLARIEKDEIRSLKILNDSYEAALRLIRHRGGL